MKIIFIFYIQFLYFKREKELNNNQLIQNLQNQGNVQRKLNNPNTNSIKGFNNINNETKQPSLEIINELNADASKESFFDNSSMANKLKNSENTEVKINNVTDNNNNNNNINSFIKNYKNQNTEIEETNKSNNILNVDSEFKKNTIINNISYKSNEKDLFSLNKNNVDNSNPNEDIFTNKDLSNNFDSKNYYSENIEIPSKDLNTENENSVNNMNNNYNKINDMYKNYSSFNGNKNNQPTQTRNKKYIGSKEEKWKNMKITSIVAERILLSQQEGIEDY